MVNDGGENRNDNASREGGDVDDGTVFDISLDVGRMDAIMGSLYEGRGTAAFPPSLRGRPEIYRWHSKEDPCVCGPPTRKTPQHQSTDAGFRRSTGTSDDRGCKLQWPFDAGGRRRSNDGFSSDFSESSLSLSDVEWDADETNELYRDSTASSPLHTIENYCTGFRHLPFRRERDDQRPLGRSAPAAPFDTLTGTGILGGGSYEKVRKRVSWSILHTMAYIDPSKSPHEVSRMNQEWEEVQLPPLPFDEPDGPVGLKATGVLGVGAQCPHEQDTRRQADLGHAHLQPVPTTTKQIATSWPATKKTTPKATMKKVVGLSRRADSAVPASAASSAASCPHDVSCSTVRCHWKVTSPRWSDCGSSDSASSSSEREDEEEVEDMAKLSPNAFSPNSNTSLPGYDLGCPARHASHMIVPPNARIATENARSLKNFDFAFVRRSSGEWAYGIVAGRPSGGDGPSIMFVLDEQGSHKIIPKNHWATGIRLVNNTLAWADCDVDDVGERTRPFQEAASARFASRMEKKGTAKKGTAKNSDTCEADGAGPMSKDSPLGKTTRAGVRPTAGTEAGAKARGMWMARESTTSVASDMAVVCGARSWRVPT